MTKRLFIALFVLFLTGIAFLVFLVGVPYGVFLFAKSFLFEFEIKPVYFFLFWILLLPVITFIVLKNNRRGT